MRTARNELQRLRAWWFRRQGFNERGPQTIADCLRRSGWLPTAGSIGIYLSMRARMPGVSRDAVDRAALDGTHVLEIPGAHARPPVLVPRDEAALALRLHWASFRKHAGPQFAGGRYSKASLEAIAAQTCRALDEGPLSASDIRARVNHRDAAELLTGALVDLAVRGVIRRYPADGRLDSSKYLYELRHPDDRPDLDSEGDDASLALNTTRRFLRCFGPATTVEIAEQTFLAKRAIRAALMALGAERVVMDGWSKDAWLLPQDAREWSTFAAGGSAVVLVPYRDPFVWIRRPQAVLSCRADAPVLNTELRPTTIGDVTVMHHQSIVADGELVGVWEYDPEESTIVTRLWNPDRKLRTRVGEAPAQTQRFIRQQLGDARRCRPSIRQLAEPRGSPSVGGAND